MNDNLFGEEDENGEVTASYTHEPGLYGELIAQQRDGETRFYNFDGLANTSELIDENENVTDTYEYSAFGEEIARTGTTANPFGYKGALGYYTNTEVGDIYVRRRPYQPKTGRWLSIDPIFLLNGANWYAYVDSNPLNWEDPSGLVPIRVEFNAFIHGKRGTWLWEPFTLRYQFKTDQRTFGQKGTSRLSSAAEIDSCAIGHKKPTGKTSPGKSHRREQVKGGWKYDSKTTTVDPDLISAEFSSPPCISEITFTVGGAYPFIKLAPKIDYKVTIGFVVSSLRGADRVDVIVLGAHDGFPDYEAVVDIGGSRKVIYRKYSKYSGPTPVSLGGGPEVDFDAIETFAVPTPECCDPSGSC